MPVEKCIRGVCSVMNFFEKILFFLQGEMECPTPYSLFHICCLLLVAAATVFLILRCRGVSDRAVRRICLVVWIVVVALEIYKQLVFSMSVTDGTATWDYQWYAFPFQFCSTPLYALPFVIWLKDGRLRDAFIAFFATFSVFGGLAVMFYPGDVFIGMIGINIQTMIHHGSQVVMGIFLFAYYRDRLPFRRLAGSVAVFAGFAATAILLNEIVFAYFTRIAMIDETFNMFFISPHYPCTLPVLSGIYDKIPYLAFLLLYLVGFALIAAIILGAEIGITALIRKCGKKQA